MQNLQHLHILGTPENCEFQFEFTRKDLQAIYAFQLEITEFHNVTSFYARDNPTLFGFHLEDTETVWIDWSDPNVFKCHGNFGYCMLWIIELVLGPIISDYTFDTQLSPNDIDYLRHIILKRKATFYHFPKLQESLDSIIMTLMHSASIDEYNLSYTALCKSYSFLIEECTEVCELLRNISISAQYLSLVDEWTSELQDLQLATCNSTQSNLVEYRHKILGDILNYLETVAEQYQTYSKLSNYLEEQFE